MNRAPTTSAAPGILGRVFGVFRPPRHAARITDPAEVQARYRHWRLRVLYTTMIGYAVFYFLRKNLSVAMPAMEADLGIQKADLGLFLTLHGLLYGCSKFFNGFLGDRANPRYFMAVGLIMAAVMNVCFGLSSAVVWLGLFWMINGYFQGMGFPPCARSITHWFSPGERATKFSIWNTSHSIGAALILVLTSFLVKYDWRLCFFVPAAIGVAAAVFVINRLRDTPPSLGLPEVEEYTGEVEAAGDVSDDAPSVASAGFVFHHVLRNPLVWAVSLANFFVYVVRYAILDWGPSFLKETKHMELGSAGLMIACFEVGGIIGMLVGGVVTDKTFKSHAGRASLVYMVLCGLAMLAFWKLEVQSWPINCLLLGTVGFFIYGPQCLVGVIAANLGTKRAAATAIGFTGLFGYASTILSGWGLGMVVDEYGWDFGFCVITACAGIAAVLFAVLWNVSASTELKNKAR